MHTLDNNTVYTCLHMITPCSLVAGFDDDDADDHGTYMYGVVA